jgi:hypothetical protein
LKWLQSVCVAVVGCSLGCSAPTACKDERWADVPNVKAAPLDDSATLDDSQRPDLHALTLKVSNLPELWQGSRNLFVSYVTLDISTEYTGDIKGNDGKTQMPRVQATLSLDGSDQHVVAQTLSFADGTVGSTQLHLFEGCAEQGTDPGCCPWGSRECTVPLSLSIARLDGAPFPPVSVAWSAQAEANATSCPLHDNVQVELGLEDVSP